MTSPHEVNGYGQQRRSAAADDRRQDIDDSTPERGAHAATAGDVGRPEKGDTNSGGSTEAGAGAGRSAPGSHSAVLTDRRSVVTREKKSYGGINWGAAFFGWLTATGTAVILTAVVIAAGAAVGVTTGITTSGGQTSQTETIGVAGAIALLAILLVAYYCGGYVAGRMARFNGVKQGIAVWLWAIVIAVVVAVAGKVLGDKYDVLAKLGGFPRLPVSGGDLTAAGVVAVVIALVAALVGAILGGLAGMRFHRNVDKAGLGA